MAVGLLVSVPLFSNQEKYTGPVPHANGNFGDLTAVVGFVVAAVLYAVLYRPLSRERSVA
jgi:NCS1 family nucleobase:cation symporter-1